MKTRTASKEGRKTHFRYSSLQSPPSAFKELIITPKFLKDVTGKSNLSLVTVLNLQFKDLRFPKIRHISGLNAVPHLRSLDVSYNAIEWVKGVALPGSLVSLNLGENRIRGIEGLVWFCRSE